MDFAFLLVNKKQADLLMLHEAKLLLFSFQLDTDNIMITLYALGIDMSNKNSKCHRNHSTSIILF